MLSDIAFSLARRDAGSVHVITSRLHYDAPGDRLPARETINGVCIHRVWTSRFGRDSLAGRAIDYLTFYLSAAGCLWRLARQGDVIIAKTDPPMLSVLAAPIARWRRAILINWLQDLFPEVAQAVGIARSRFSERTYGLLRKLRDRSLRRAACNVVLGARMQDRIATFGIAARQIRVIPNFADGVEIVPSTADENGLRAAWGLRDKFVVGYAGNLGRAHEYRTMLAAMRLTGPGIAWLVVGSGALIGVLEREAHAHRLTNVRFAPYQPQDRLSESLSAADVHLVCLRPELEGLIVPSKFYGICAAGRPTIFIGDENGEIARLVREHSCGHVVAPGDGATLARTVEMLAADRAHCREMGARARRALEDDFDRTIAVDRWQALLQEVAGRSGAG